MNYNSLIWDKLPCSTLHESLLYDFQQFRQQGGCNHDSRRKSDPYKNIACSFYTLRVKNQAACKQNKNNDDQRLSQPLLIEWREAN